jgi:hypothetical protein
MRATLARRLDALERNAGRDDGKSAPLFVWHDDDDGCYRTDDGTTEAEARAMRTRPPRSIVRFGVSKDGGVHTDE